MSNFIMVSADINCHVICHNMFVSHWCSQHTRGRISIFTSVRFASSVTADDKKHKITDIHNKNTVSSLSFAYSPDLFEYELFYFSCSHPVSPCTDFSLSLSEMDQPLHESFKLKRQQKVVQLSN